MVYLIAILIILIIVVAILLLKKRKSREEIIAEIESDLERIKRNLESLKILIDSMRESSKVKKHGRKR
jgi:sensor domain CHASE-containing protein